MDVLGLVAFIGLGGLFFKKGCDHIGEAQNPHSSERVSACLLGVAFLIIGLSGFVLAGMILLR